MFKIISHTADIGLELISGSISELFTDSMQGFYEITLGKRFELSNINIQIQLEGENYEELLVNWLSELNYILTMKYLYVTRIISLQLTSDKDRKRMFAESTPIFL